VPFGVHPGASLQFGERVIAVTDPRVFQLRNRQFCEQLMRAALGRPAISSVQVSLEDQTCRMWFSGADLPDAEMAVLFAGAVQDSLAGASGCDDPFATAMSHTNPTRQRAFSMDARGWETLSAFKNDSAVSVWAAVRKGPQRLRLSNPRIRRQPRLAEEIAAQVEKMPGVASCRFTFWAPVLHVRFEPEKLPVADLIASVESLRQRASPPSTSPAASDATTAVGITQGRDRRRYLALAAGSFTLSVVGLVVPFVPTIAFLLLTSYYLARCSTFLHEKLHEARFFGSILRDLEEEGGLGRESKRKLILFALAMSLVQIVVFPSLVSVGIAVFLTSISIAVVLRVKDIPSGELVVT
jgi:uncharacterized membrane protein YbaN (DUF454 family)